METIVNILVIVGIVSFSASGAMSAIDREMDAFGVLLMAVITCFGGGLIRDVLVGAAIGIDRPWFFSGDPTANLYIVISAVTAIAVFFVALAFKKLYVKEERLVFAVNNILDAIGIGVFAAMGTEKYVSTGPFIAITMGMVTCIGGGLIRDVIFSEVPSFLKKHVYALPTIAGSAAYYVVYVYVLPGVEYAKMVATVTCLVIIFVLRVLATYFKWNMPKAIDFHAIRRELKQERFKKNNP